MDNATDTTPHIRITYKTVKGKRPKPHRIELDAKDRPTTVTGGEAGDVSRLIGFTPKTRPDFALMVLASDTLAAGFDLDALGGWRAQFAGADGRPFGYTPAIESVEVIR